MAGRNAERYAHVVLPKLRWRQMVKPHGSRTLVVITGPVGVGKSTAANVSARQLRATGLSVACVDLDQLYCMARQQDGFDDEGTWRIARQTAAHLCDHFFQCVASVVIVEGGFLKKEEQDELVDGLNAKPHIHFITLHASYETVQTRVMADADPGRVASKIPSILRRLYTEYEAALPFLRNASNFLQVDTHDVEQVGEQIAIIVNATADAPSPSVNP
jgi:shikimate kinase